LKFHLRYVFYRKKSYLWVAFFSKAGCFFGSGYGFRCRLAGADLNNGTNAGAAACNANDAVALSNQNVSAPLYFGIFVKKNRKKALPLGKK
jgi:hypothetical protein